MTQNWGPPTYPPRPPQYQPPQYQQLPDPEPDEYYDEGPRQRSPLFYGLVGGCATLLLVGCCAALLAVGWVLDTRYGWTTPNDVTTTSVPAMSETAQAPQPVSPGGVQPVQPVAPGGEQPQQSPTTPAQSTAFPRIGEAVVAPEIGIELTALDVRRSVQPMNLAPADGMEFVSVSIQLRSVAPSTTPQIYEIGNFKMRNNQQVIYDADPQADNGRRLSGGQLSDGTLVEGDLLFHVIAADAPLYLLWQPVAGGQTYTIELQ